MEKTTDFEFVYKNTADDVEKLQSLPYFSICIQRLVYSNTSGIKIIYGRIIITKFRIKSQGGSFAL